MEKRTERNDALCVQLVRAAGMGDEKRVSELLHTEGVDARFVYDMVWGLRATALVCACKAGHFEAATVLLDFGGESAEELNAAFLCSAAAGHLELVKVLMKRGANSNLQKSTALCWAANFGHSELVQLLLS